MLEAEMEFSEAPTRPSRLRRRPRSGERSQLITAQRRRRDCCAAPVSWISGWVRGRGIGQVTGQGAGQVRRRAIVRGIGQVMGRGVGRGIGQVMGRGIVMGHGTYDRSEDGP